MTSRRWCCNTLRSWCVEKMSTRCQFVISPKVSVTAAPSHTQVSRQEVMERQGAEGTRQVHMHHTLWRQTDVHTQRACSCLAGQIVDSAYVRHLLFCFLCMTHTMHTDDEDEDDMPDLLRERWEGNKRHKATCILIDML